MLLAGGLLTQTAADSLSPRGEAQGEGRGSHGTATRLRAVYMRGGTSRCLAFHDRDLPPAGPGGATASCWPRSAARTLRPPARRPGRRHLVAVARPRHRAARPARRRGRLHVRPGRDRPRGRRLHAATAATAPRRSAPSPSTSGSCPTPTAATAVRIHNTNTRKIIVARVPVVDGEAAVARRLRAARRGRARGPHRARLPRARRRA